MDYEDLPPQVVEILDRYNETWEETDAYSSCTALEKELAAVGWQMEWGLDGIPGDFEPIPYAESDC